MRIFGIGFTSSPSRRKRITCARCSRDAEKLVVQAIDEFTDFESFDRLLELGGPWVAGMDFPFGQPRRLIENLGWPLSWEGCVRKVSEMTKTEFVDLLVDYSKGRPPGDRHHQRETERRFRRPLGSRAMCNPSSVGLAEQGSQFRNCRLLRPT